MGSADPDGLELIDPEAPDLKRLWIAKRDVRFAARAIGRWPADPPPWAVIACYVEHRRWQRSAVQGYAKDRDGAVLDEVIRVYFRLEDEARARPDYLPSTYEPPAQRPVIALALLHVEELHEGSDTFRSRMVAIERRLDEEAALEGYPVHAVDGARRTARYERLLYEWGAAEVGAPSHLHSLVRYFVHLVEAP